MAATDERVQAYVDNQVRPHCAIIVNAVIQMQYDSDTIDDVYAALTSTPTWSDSETTAVPLTPADVLAYNTFISDVTAYINAHASWSVVAKACKTSPV